MKTHLRVTEKGEAEVVVWSCNGSNQSFEKNVDNYIGVGECRVKLVAILISL